MQGKASRLWMAKRQGYVNAPRMKVFPSGTMQLEKREIRSSIWYILRSYHDGERQQKHATYIYRVKTSKRVHL